MQRKLVIALPVLVVVLIGAFQIFSGEKRPDDANMASLRQQAARRRAAALEAEQRAKTDLALLAMQGRGQELPEYLVSEIDREGNFWFVGKADSTAGVQIPFAPGKLPLPPADISNTQSHATLASTREYLLRWPNVYAYATWRRARNLLLPPNFVPLCRRV